MTFDAAFFTALGQVIMIDLVLAGEIHPIRHIENSGSLTSWWLLEGRALRRRWFEAMWSSRSI